MRKQKFVYYKSLIYLSEYYSRRKEMTEEKIQINEQNMAVLNSIIKEGFAITVDKKKPESKPKDINQTILNLIYIALCEGYER